MRPHTLIFLEPGHFHAALTVRERHPRVGDDIFVYAERGPELDDFLALIEAFNRRRDRPTAWRPIVRSGERPLDRLERDRPGDVVILAGRNDRKMRTIRRLHDAGFHVLADKPWLVGADGLEDVRHVLARGPVVMEIMTGRHDVTSILASKLVGDRDAFGELTRAPAGSPAISSESVHFLEKIVNGDHLRRPTWFFDVRVQGDGIADIPTHLVDQAQRLVAAAGAATPGTRLRLTGARRWATTVPVSVFSRVTGVPDFTPELCDQVRDATLSYAGNAAMTWTVNDVGVSFETRWDLTAPADGGDTHRTLVRGTRAEIHIEQSARTGFRRELEIGPLIAANEVGRALERLVDAWQSDHPGVRLTPSRSGWRVQMPRELALGHERHFPLVLEEFLALVEGGDIAAVRAADTLAKYSLLAQASIAADVA